MSSALLKREKLRQPGPNLDFLSAGTGKDQSGSGSWSAGAFLFNSGWRLASLSSSRG
jgi:hypothetical protein